MTLNRNHVAVLGATGSIGTATADVLQHLAKTDPDGNWRMWAASGHQNLPELTKIAAQMDSPPQRLILSSPEAAKSFDGTDALASKYDVGVGTNALVDVAMSPEVDTVVAAIVGRAGLESTLAAIDAGKRVGLANKETMVVAGPLVRQMMAKSGSELLPVDSEHSAIFQCLGNWASTRADTRADGTSGDSDAPANHAPKPRKLILTASGGPFREWSSDRIADASPADALAHPTWEMGRKISIDSATMMNKALEIIEARWLFDLPADAIEVFVHPQSIIHSMVEFDDGSVIAQMSPPDMRLPIQFALTYPRRLPSQSPPLCRKQSYDLTLEPADHGRFPALSLGFEVAKAGGTAGAVLNAANERAVGLFLDGKIRFTDIAAGCRDVLENHTHEENPSLSRMLELDRWARVEVDRRFSQ
ncbi:1-deoxy-D-xylulose 5-phosphate reductoisomerase [Rubripirellula obstinata]|uniref:1-deoxy-D-xylulose 5-phosphate reductoisomerase n=1 Tax=Rubripirellula obstinata TaxID=406547 RepID=A0A5B1CMC4_9BACT|nr:1-deoxy-D-xylulose-5-phosphate reductoisomerase [Rubripirellula obstinata]KAA1262337.1 1-deoxy-D-xylulose 5-phosphate reductoisomerase [Rubripirellula obstinata]